MEFQQDQISDVQKAVKSEMKSWADIVQKNDSQSKQITTKKSSSLSKRRGEDITKPHDLRL